MRFSRQFPFFVLLATTAIASAQEMNATSDMVTPPDGSVATSRTAESDPPYDLDPVIVTAQRYGRAVGAQSRSVSVIQAGELKKLQVRNTLDLLARLPGVSVARSGGLGGQIALRGSNSNTPRSVLYVDGERFRGRNTLEYNLLDPSEIERIEVVRGPMSSLYGSDAINGVVNVIRRRAKAAEGLRGGLRALETNSANALRGARFELEAVGAGLDLLAGYGYRKADDYWGTSTPIPNSAYETQAADFALGWRPSPGQRLELSGKWGQAISGRAGGIGGAPGVPFVWQREDPLKELFGRLGYHWDDPGLGLDRLETSVYARNLESQLVSDNFTQMGPPQRQRVESVNYVRGPLVTGAKMLAHIGTDRNRVVMGIEGFYESRPGAESYSRTTKFNASGGVTSVTIADRTQTVPDSHQGELGAFLHHDWDAHDWLLVSTGLRVDRFESGSKTDPLAVTQTLKAYQDRPWVTESPVTGSLSLLWKPWSQLHFTGLWARAYRVATTAESYASSRQGAGFNVPNPDLRSEEAYHYEAGVRAYPGSLRLSFTGFQTDFSQLLARRPVIYLGTASFQTQNAGAAIMRGAELEADWPFDPNWSARATAAYAWGVDLTTERPLAYVPPLNGRFGLERRWQIGWMGIDLRWALNKERFDPTSERFSDGYAVIDLRAGTRLWEGGSWMPAADFSVALENVGNHAYSLAATNEDVRFPRSQSNPLQEPGRNVSAKLSTVF